jgi:tetratricopeptide (TPR) repeat protein
MKNLFFSLVIVFAGYTLSVAQLPDKSKKEAKKAYNQAVQLIRSGNYAEAVQYCNLSLELDETFSDALLLKAKTRIELGDIEGAREDFLGVTFFDPSLGESYFFLGYLDFTNDTVAGVLKNFDKAISNGFTEYQVYFYRGLYQMKAGNYSEAIVDFSEAINQKQNFAIAYHERASAKRSLGDMQGALYDYRLATNYQHDFPVAFNNMGSVKSILGDFEGALEDYNVAINLDPGFFVALNNRGTIHYFLGNLDQAKDDFELALSLNPDYLPSKNNKASVSAKNNENAIAVSLFNEILEADSSYAKAFLNRGLVKELMGDLKGACEDWNRAYELGIAEAAGYIEECD